MGRLVFIWRFILWLPCLLPGNACGQTPGSPFSKPPHKVIDVEQGLPQSFVSGIVEDEDGFIWVSTLGGLARYDGRQMVPFYYQANNPASPLNNTISALVKGRANEIWLLYENGGCSRLNTRTGRCTHFPKLAGVLYGLLPRSCAHVDQRGNYWTGIRRQGIVHYNVDDQSITPIRRATHGLLSDTIRAITEDRQGNIWVVSPKGLNQITYPDKGRRFVVRSVRFTGPMAHLDPGTDTWSPTRAILRANGEIMFNDQTGLYIVDPRHPTTIRSVRFAHSNADSQPWLCHGSDGIDYVQVDQTLFRYSDKQELVPVWQYEPPSDMPGNKINCRALCKARSGVMWLGANTQGLHQIDLAAVPLRSFANKTTFCVDALQTGLGLRLPALFHWPFNNPTAQTSYLFRSDYDPRGRLWLGLGNELVTYDPRTKAVQHMADLPANMDHNGALRGLSIDPQGTVWAVSGGGLPMHFDTLSQRWNTPFGKLPDFSLPANDLLADSDAVWVTTAINGLVRFDRTTKNHQFIHFKNALNGASETHLLDLTSDPTRPNLLWISSYNGLICYDKRTGRRRVFTTEQGLPNNVVYAVMADKQGYLWLSTNQGLCRFDPRTYTLLTLDVEDGLPGNEFNRFHRLRFPDDQLAFGGVKGWVMVDPAQIRPDTAKPMVALTGLTINNQPVDQFGPRSPLAEPINNLPELQLTHDQNYLTISFTALLYHQPGRVTYRYKLLGYDPDWTVSKLPTANYTKLPPGTYTLQVNAANSSGQWSRQVKEMSLVIRPPFWANGWAYALYILLLGSGIMGAIRFNTTRVRERHELALRQRQAEELQRLDQAKTRFFANVSHELRTPLTLVMGPLSSLLHRKQVSPHDQQLIQTASRSAHQLLGLVNELLDLTKLEAGKLQLHPQPIRLRQFFQDCLLPFTTQAHQLGVTLRLDMPGNDDPTVVVDAGKVRQITQNLLANAHKFTPPGGTVELKVACSLGRLRWQVRDTGRGIHPNDLPHIFERYFQTNQPNAPLEGGTGIGLALCQELIRLMQGTIAAESEWGKGSLFAAAVPVEVIPNAPPSQPGPVSQPTAGIQLDHLVSEVLAQPTSQATETVLVVEDNADLRTYLTAVLSPSLRVLTAAHGQAALTLLAGLPKPPSLIVADIMMPVMDGFQLLESLKRHPAYRTIPVMMLTARTDMADKLRALRLGVDDYLLKPFHEAELTARVSALLHNQRERQWQAVVEPLDQSYAGSALTEAPVHTAPAESVVSAEDLAWLERLEQLTESQLGHTDLVADDLADAMNMSRRTFYRSIKRLTGLTPAQYVSEARFRQARQLLETRQVSSVKQAAHQVGFLQVSHFSQQYQQRFGKSPAEYL